MIRSLELEEKRWAETRHEGKWRGSRDELSSGEWSGERQFPLNELGSVHTPNGKEEGFRLKLISSSLDLRIRESLSNFGKALRGRDDNFGLGRSWG